ncbi:MAG: fibronectin type III-like domain-contianing protein, partial [Caldisericaceae bacterium]|nr:fibronectin type III-like domain-contianing protein [Caldisericaceae bacterium]
VWNAGPVAGDEVIQVYVKHLNASVRVPIISLQAFKRVHLKPNEKRTIEFELGSRQLAVLNDQMRWMVEPGELEISVGGGQPGKAAHSTMVLKKRIRVVGQTYFIN